MKEESLIFYWWYIRKLFPSFVTYPGRRITFCYVLKLNLHGDVMGVENLYR